MSIKTLPTLYLGTMTFGWSQVFSLLFCCLCEFLTFGRNKASSAVTDDVAKSFLDKFAAAGGVEVDCARIYAGGESEEMLGRVLAGLPWLSRRSTLWL